MPNAGAGTLSKPNGDRWSLKDDDRRRRSPSKVRLSRLDGKVQVLHEPNAASGGRPSRLEVGDFLVRDAHGPQRAELLRLIGRLVGDVDRGGSPILICISPPELPPHRSSRRG